MASVDFITLGVVLLIVLALFALFAALGRWNRKIIALLVLIAELAVAVWMLLAYQDADNDVDLIITGLLMIGAFMLMLVSGAGWFVGRLWLWRSAR